MGYKAEVYNKWKAKNLPRLKHLAGLRLEKRKAEKAEKRKAEQEALHPLLRTLGSKRRKGKIFICPQCNVEFYRRPCDVSGQCCSLKCKHAYQARNKVVLFCVICGKEFHVSPSYKNKRTCCRVCTGKYHSQIARAKRESKPPCFREYKALHLGAELRDWRKSVFLRDNYTCRWTDCEVRGGYLEAHHIRRFKEYPSLRLVLDNGITLCREHHNKTRNREEKLIPFFEELMQKHCVNDSIEAVRP